MNFERVNNNFILTFLLLPSLLKRKSWVFYIDTFGGFLFPDFKMQGTLSNVSENLIASLIFYI